MEKYPVSAFRVEDLLKKLEEFGYQIPADKINFVTTKIARYLNGERLIVIGQCKQASAIYITTYDNSSYINASSLLLEIKGQNLKMTEAFYKRRYYAWFQEGILLTHLIGVNGLYKSYGLSLINSKAEGGRPIINYYDDITNSSLYTSTFVDLYHSCDNWLVIASNRQSEAFISTLEANGDLDLFKKSYLAGQNLCEHSYCNVRAIEDLKVFETRYGSKQR